MAEFECRDSSNFELGMDLGRVVAAICRCASGGLIPQAKHGGIGVEAFARAGLKFDGSGLEYEHIGQTHVPDGSKAAAPDDGGGKIEGVPEGRGEADALREDGCTGTGDIICRD